MAESSFSHSVSINVILHPKVAFICSIPEVTLTGGVGRVIPSVLQHSFTLIYLLFRQKPVSVLLAEEISRRSFSGWHCSRRGCGFGSAWAA